MILSISRSPWQTSNTSIRRTPSRGASRSSKLNFFPLWATNWHLWIRISVQDADPNPAPAVIYLHPCGSETLPGGCRGCGWRDPGWARGTAPPALASAPDSCSGQATWQPGQLCIHRLELATQINITSFKINFVRTQIPVWILHRKFFPQKPIPLIQ